MLCEIMYGETSIIRTPLGRYQTVPVTEVYVLTLMEVVQVM